MKNYDGQAWKEDISSQKSIFKAQKYFRNSTDRRGWTVWFLGV